MLVEGVVPISPLRTQTGLHHGHGTAVLTKDGYLGQLPSNIMNGHPPIQAHTTDTKGPYLTGRRPPAQGHVSVALGVMPGAWSSACTVKQAE